jgi:hypothetical protein
MRPGLFAPLACASAFVAVGSLACGPSFQVVYEGDARFEHCYALDETATVSMQEKTDCWTQWSRRYTYGQTRNRVDYAATRAKALREVPSLPTDEAVMSAAPGGGATRPLGQDEPVTTNAFATPPKTMSDGDAGLETSPENGSVNTMVSTTVRPAVAVVPAVAAPVPPAAACAGSCLNTFTSCQGASTGTSLPPARRTCDASYTGCMKKCFSTPAIAPPR